MELKFQCDQKMDSLQQSNKGILGDQIMNVLEVILGSLLYRTSVASIVPDRKEKLGNCHSQNILYRY